MLNRILADFYKLFHRMYLYGILIALGAIALLVSIVLKQSGMTFETSIEVLPMLLSYPLFLIPMASDMLISEENKEHTVKNTISYGISRNGLLLSKTISCILVMFLIAAVTLAVYFISALVLLKTGDSSAVSELLKDTASRMVAAFALYVAAAILCALLSSVITKNTTATFAYYGFLLAPSLLFNLLSFANPWFGKLPKYTLYSQSSAIASAAPEKLIYTVILAGVYAAVFLIGGLILYRRKEIQ